MVVLVQSVAKDNLPPEQKSKADFQDVSINSAGKTEWKNLYELFSSCQESTLTLPLTHSVRFLDSCTKFESGAPNGSVPQNICSSGQVFLAGKFGEINMSLEGKCCWAIHNSGCQRGFVVYNSLYILFFLSLLPPLKGWMSPLGHTQLPMDSPPPPPHRRAEFCPKTTPKLGSND